MITLVVLCIGLIIYSYIFDKECRSIINGIIYDFIKSVIGFEIIQVIICLLVIAIILAIFG